MKLLTATLFAALSLSACVATPPVTPQSLTLNANQQNNLRTDEAKWQQLKPVHYAYTLQRSCFCTPDATKPIEIRVFRGKVQQATVLPDGTPLPADRQASALTIDDLFLKIHDAIDRNAASLSVTYDPQYGFPTNISIDYERMMADEELSLSASNFKIASGLKPIQQH